MCRGAKLLEEGRLVLLRLWWELLNQLDPVGVAGGLSRQVGEEVQGGEVGGLLLSDVEGVVGEHSRLVALAGEEERVEGEEGGG